MVEEIVRSSQMVDKVVFVDGQPGCGKSMFSALITGLDRVELLCLAYEIEFVCALKYLQKIDDDVARSLVGLYTDLRMYNLMMSRETNFRPSDVSSVFKDARPFRYIKRLFQKGRDLVPDLISRERPILHLTTHDLLGRSDPIFDALRTKCVFIEVVRHPLYMIKQQAINMKSLISDPRHFEIYFLYKGKELPYFAYGREEAFLKGNEIDKAIYVIDGMTRRNESFRRKAAEKNINKDQILTIPFEKFVIDPWQYLKHIENILDTKRLPVLSRLLKKQNVPRKMYADGIELEIYKSCGWEPSKPGSDESKEFATRRQFAKDQASSEAMRVLDKLSEEYEKEYLGGKHDY